MFKKNHFMEFPGSFLTSPWQKGNASSEKGWGTQSALIAEACLDGVDALERTKDRRGRMMATEKELYIFFLIHLINPNTCIYTHMSIGRTLL